MITTRLTEMLQCDHPVMLAGMGGVSYSNLVVAVSEAGGFGTMGAAFRWQATNKQWTNCGMRTKN